MPDGVPLDVTLPGAGALDWVDLDHGISGYRKAMAYGAVQVHHDGQPGMGAMVHLSGQGCRELEAALDFAPDGSSWLDLYRYILDSGFHVARVDHAIDDRSGELSMETVLAAAAAGELTSKWHKWKVEQQGDGDGLRDNRTITFGSPQSNSRLRIYDKRAEQLEKGNDPGEAPWIRVELQLRDEQAAALMRQLVESDGSAEALLGVIRGHLEFKEPSDTDGNKSRWAPAAWWAAFLQHATKRRLGIGRPARSLETVLRWADRQVAPALALIVRAHGGSWRHLRRLVDAGDRRLKARDLALLAPELRWAG